jgi:hypothetical protein
MNKTLSTILIVLAILVLAGGIFFAGIWAIRSTAFRPAWMGSMMGGVAWNNANAYGPISGYGSGMMGGRGGYGWNNQTNSALVPLTVAQAKADAGKYLEALNNPDLQIAEVMIFSNNAYVAVKEASTGYGAFELLVDPVSQVAYPEYGPNMMWNLKYGAMNHGSITGGRGYGMMGGRGYGMTLAPGASSGVGGWNAQYPNPTNVSATMPVTKDQAIKAAQSYLDQYQSGALAADDPMQFYGYYTLDFSKDGKVVGMLSVNGYSGRVFLHIWHGSFIEESQV